MKRSKFSLSHTRLLSCDMGELVPVGVTEVLPGDTFQHSTNLLLRVSPLLAPVMHPVRVRIHHWFVPHRLTWENWEKFITGGPDGMDASTFPTVNLTWAAGSPPTGSGVVGGLADYFGMPTGINNFPVSALPFRAYALIFNEWYRDQDLVSALALSTADGVDSTTNTALQFAAWEKDRFTSSRPWTQKGPEISIPLVGNAPVKGIGALNTTWNSGAFNVHESGNTSPTFIAANNAKNINPGDVNNSVAIVKNPSNNYPNIYADLSNVSAADINDLRLAFALQRYEEARARYGSRYTEYLAYLGIKSSDARLQRPEYLGGGRQTIQFSEVLQTSPGTGPNVVGQLRGHGISAMRSNRYRRFFEEHGYVITLMSVLPKTMYVQGSPRTFNRRVKEDFWQRELEHIGQQEVANKELYAAHASPDGVFGYQDRYDEYRRQESGVSGEFRTTALDYWHMARIFSSSPALNASFVTSNPTKRINAVQTEDVLWIQANHSLQARRLVSASGRSYIF